MKSVSSLCLLSGLVLLSSTVIADQYHYGNLLVGGKAIGYGGAYVAIADDLSAMHYNPAGLAFQEASTSASVNTMAFEDTEFLGVFSDGSDVKRSSFTVVPGFIGLSGKQGKLSYGSFFTVMDFSQERSTSQTEYTIEGDIPQDVVEFVDYDLDNASYKVGGSLAYEYSDNFAIGMSLALVYKDFITTQGSGAFYTFPIELGGTTTGFNAQQRVTEEQYIVEPTIGALWKTDTLNIGVKYSQQFSINRNFESTIKLVAPGVLAIDPYHSSAFFAVTQSDEKQQYPHQFSLGMSKQFSKLNISVQVDYYSSVDDLTYQPETALPDTVNLDSVTNYSAGVEYNIDEDTALQLAFFTDNSNGVIDINQTYQRIEKIDVSGVSLAYKSKLLDLPFRFGVYVKKGSGNIRFSDLRFVEAAFGIPFYPTNDNYDISKARKSAVVIFASMDF